MDDWRRMIAIECADELGASLLFLILEHRLTCNDPDNGLLKFKVLAWTTIMPDNELCLTLEPVNCDGQAIVSFSKEFIEGVEGLVAGLVESMNNKYHWAPVIKWCIDS